MGGAAWMDAGVPDIGETFVFGKTTEMARYLLAAAEELGYDPAVVRTARDGFVVPDDVWDLVTTGQQAGTDDDNEV